MDSLVGMATGFVDVPSDALVHILVNIDAHSLIRLRETCRLVDHLVASEEFWRQFVRSSWFCCDLLSSEIRRRQFNAVDEMLGSRVSVVRGACVSIQEMVESAWGDFSHVSVDETIRPPPWMVLARSFFNWGTKEDMHLWFVVDLVCSENLLRVPGLGKLACAGA